MHRLSPQDPIYLGYALRLEDDNQKRSRTWMSGGAGYVLSWRAFQDMIAILKTSAEQEENILALKVRKVFLVIVLKHYTGCLNKVGIC